MTDSTKNQKLRLFRELINKTNDAIFVADTETGLIIDFNERACTSTGYSREELLNMHVMDVDAVTKEYSLWKRQAKEISEKGSIIFESSHKRKDGTTFPVEINVNYYSLKGHDGYVIGIARDITERKKYEETLRARDELLQQAVHVSQIGIFDHDQRTDTIYWSPQQRLIHGWGPDEEVNLQDFLNQVHPYDRESISAAVQRAHDPKGDGIWDVEHRIIRRDGSVRWLKERSQTFFEGEDNTRRPVRTVGAVLDITERRKSEEALRESEKCYHILFDQSPDGILLINAEGRIIEFNESAHRQLGYSCEEFAQLSISDFDPFESPDEVKARIRKIILEGRAEFKVKHRTKQGELRDVQVFIQTVMLSGNPVLYSIWHDITEIKNVRDKLEEKTAEQNTILENTLAGIAFLKDRRFIWINSKMEEMFGYQRSEVSGLTTEVFYPSYESYEQLGKEAYPLLAGGQTYLSERLMKRKDGSVFWCSLSGKAIDPYAMSKGSIWILQDISERKQAEEALRESENLLRESQIIAGLGSYILDIPTGLWRSSDLLDNLFGINEAYEHSVEGWVALVYPEDRTMMVDYFRNEVLGQGKTFDKEYRIIRYDDQSERRVHGLGRLEFDVHGCPLKMIGTIQDITGRKKMEEQLRQTQKLESIGTLAGGIAHDFNNLLQGVFGYISLAKVNHDQKEKSLSMLEQAEAALHLAVNLTTQLLTFSKGGKPVKKLIRLRPAVENAVKFALSGSNTNYEMDIQADLWSVEADEGQLAQVIQNIVLNANEAMAGSGTVGLSLRNVDITKDSIVNLPDGGQFVRIAIQDSGIGINEQNLKRIFDPYFTTKQKGSGLGLATSYSIIKNHGGVIEVNSEVNKGTMFTIYLPASKIAEMETATTASDVAGTKKGKILLMDDEELVRNVAEEMVAALGHNLVCAEDGRKAIDLFQQAREAGKPFDLVILDLTVKGGMGGEEAIRKIRDIDPNVKAVVSSGYADSPIVADYRAYGFSAVLNKPYKLDALQSCFNQLISFEGPDRP